jgi:hypothetical protein
MGCCCEQLWKQASGSAKSDTKFARQEMRVNPGSLQSLAPAGRHARAALFYSSTYR